MERTDIAQLWVEEFQASVDYNINKTGVTPDQWKSSGPKTKANPTGEDVEWWASNGLDMVEAYWDWFQKLPASWKIATMPDGAPGIEWAVEVEFGGSPVKAVIDCIFEADGELIIVDFKSGKKSPYGVIQLALYACAIEQKYGIRPKWGGFYLARKAELDEIVDLKWWRQSYFDYCFNAMNKSIEQNLYPPIVSDACGWGCDFKDQCVAVGGKDSDNYPLEG